MNALITNYRNTYIFNLPTIEPNNLLNTYLLDTSVKKDSILIYDYRVLIYDYRVIPLVIV